MEAKFFKEIEKKMDVKTLKDFEKEVRTKINQEFEIVRKTNDYLARILLVGECDLWKKIKDGGYKWIKIKEDRKERLFRLIEIYSQFRNLMMYVETLNEKVDEIKKLKDAPEDDHE